VQRLMRKMGIAALGPKPRTTKPEPGHGIFPYLLRGAVIDRPNQVWAADITYVPIGRGFLYLVAIMDWASRAVLAWRLSNSMDVSFCISALEEALARFGKPDIFNTDQGSQFTSAAFTGVLLAAGIKVSMDGRGRWMDNVFIERLWRSLKHEDIYLKGYADGHEAKAGIASWVAFYNLRRPHQSLGHRTPMTVWREGVSGVLDDVAVDMTLRSDVRCQDPRSRPLPRLTGLLPGSIIAIGPAIVVRLSASGRAPHIRPAAHGGNSTHAVLSPDAEAALVRRAEQEVRASLPGVMAPGRSLSGARTATSGGRAPTS